MNATAAKGQNAHQNKLLQKMLPTQPGNERVAHFFGLGAKNATPSRRCASSTGEIKR
jgi:hypothetical protein